MKKVIATAVLSAAFGVLSCSSGAPSEVTSDTDEALATGGGSTTVRVTCASQLFQRRECSVDTQGGRITDARIVEDNSNPPYLCRQGDSNGVTANSVWVDHGCSAVFELTIDLPSSETREQIRCASDGGHYTVCDSRLTQIRRIRLIRQESGAACEQGRSFGYYDDAVWVDRGCRGVFEVTGRRGGGSSFGVDLYDRQGGQGNRVTVTNTVNDLSSVGFNDRTESIVVRGGNWEICQHADFNGWCRTFGPGQYDDLGPLRGEVSSVRPR